MLLKGMLSGTIRPMRPCSRDMCAWKGHVLRRSPNLSQRDVRPFHAALHLAADSRVSFRVRCFSFEEADPMPRQQKPTLLGTLSPVYRSLDYPEKIRHLLGRAKLN